MIGSLSTAARSLRAGIAGAVLTIAPVSGAGAEAPTSCRELYVAKLQAARQAALRGDQREAVELLEAARDVEQLCTDGPAGARGPDLEQGSIQSLSERSSAPATPMDACGTDSARTSLG